MGIVVQLVACLCLLPYASSSDCAIEQEVDGDQHLSLLQYKANDKSGNVYGSVSIYDSSKVDPSMPVMMSPNETELLGKYLAASKGYLEFGAGGSTVFALTYPNLQRIQVVESDPAWVEKLKDRSDIAVAEQTHRLQFHLVDIGPTTQYGFPESTGIDNGFPPPPPPDLAKKFARYSSMDGIDMSNLDFALIDGRFRVACFLQALKHAAPDTRIAMHDYPGRPHYSIVEKYADTVEQAERLRIFKPKANMDPTSLDNDISKYEVVPAL